MKNLIFFMGLLILFSCQNSNTYINQVKKLRIPHGGERSVAEILESYKYFQDIQWYVVQDREQNPVIFDDYFDQEKAKVIVRFVGLLDSLEWRQQCVDYFNTYKNNKYPPERIKRRRQVDQTLSDVLNQVQHYGLAVDFGFYDNGSVRLMRLENVIIKQNFEPDKIPSTSDNYDLNKMQHILRNERFPLAFAYIHKGNWQEW